MVIGIALATHPNNSYFTNTVAKARSLPFLQTKCDLFQLNMLQISQMDLDINLSILREPELHLLTNFIFIYFYIYLFYIYFIFILYLLFHSIKTMKIVESL